jgi:hypothetical protein
LKRALNPAVDDVGVRKKVSISHLFMESGDTNGAPIKADKALIPVPKKPNTRGQQSKKVEEEASEKERKPTRDSRGKNK